MNYESNNRLERRSGRLAEVEPWASVIGGSALALFGVTRKSLSGAALAAVGGYLVYHGATASERGLQQVHVEKAFTINKPAAELYSFWRNFANLPRFMSHLESVEVTGDRYSQWKARAPLGGTVAWHAEITDERENEYLVWRSLPGSDLEVNGSVEFRPAPGDRGTEVRAAISYTPPAGKLGHVVAGFFGESPEQQIREDLRHFKQLMEAGEIPTTEGQPHGRRSLMVSAVQRAYRDPQQGRYRPGMPRTA
jgi:uncharacterized membrane protein